MKFHFEQSLSYRILALVVLGVFYGIYFVKMYIQKRRGIRTNQIGTRKEKKLHTVEILMSAATVGAVIAELVSIILDFNYMPSGARFTGFLIGIAGDAFFLVSVITMKDSWRAGIPKHDRTKLVTEGIYSFSRNPAFLGFDFMYIGLMFMYFNPLSVIFSLFAAVMLHLQILQEEKYMSAVFGESYAEYRKRVFRYLGRYKN